MSLPLDREHVMPITKEVQVGRVWRCKAGNDPCTRTEPCRSCLGRRNRRKGSSKQRMALSAIAAPNPRYGSQRAHEENILGGLRAEVKAGQQVKAMTTRYLAAEAQSELARPLGDVRPFAFLAMPDGISDGLFVCRLSKLRDVVEALVLNYGDS